MKIPSPGESITEVEVASWLVSDGDLVGKDQELAEIESDKATLMLSAPEAGKISIQIKAGETVSVGQVACTIDTSVEVPEVPEGDENQGKEEGPTTDEGDITEEKRESKKEEASKEKEKEAVESKPSPPTKDDTGEDARSGKKGSYPDVKTTPLAREKMKAAGLSVEDVIAGLKKLTSSNVDAVLSGATSPSSTSSAAADRAEDRNKMSQLRKKLSQRLVKVKNETAMLTTFNEVDMQAIMSLRKTFQEAFVEKHGVKLGFMSLFMKASAIALKNRSMVNSMIDGDEIVTPRYVDISIAVQTPKGLMVPVIRDVDTINLPTIEKQLAALADKARSGKITLEEMDGGTFTITNGGIFGSMLSTPLINPPQSAILGMHNIIERPVAINGKVEIRPMMYVALSYDHRLIDGKDSVGFLMDVKKMLEEPHSLLDGGRDPLRKLLHL